MSHDNDFQIMGDQEFWVGVAWFEVLLVSFIFFFFFNDGQVSCVFVCVNDMKLDFSWMDF